MGVPLWPLLEPAQFRRVRKVIKPSERGGRPRLWIVAKEAGWDVTKGICVATHRTIQNPRAQLERGTARLERLHVRVSQDPKVVPKQPQVCKGSRPGGFGRAHH